MHIPEGEPAGESIKTTVWCSRRDVLTRPIYPLLIVYHSLQSLPYCPTSMSAVDLTQPSNATEDNRANRMRRSSQAAEDHINTLLPPIKQTIQAYLESDAGLPLWEPSAVPANVVEHIRSLKIPALPSSPHLPSLLLHNIGGPFLGLDHRVQKLFDENRTTHT